MSSGNPGLRVQLGVRGSDRGEPQVGRDGELPDGRVDGGEVGSVQLLDLAPLRVEVGLGQHACHVRRDAHGVAEELDLGLRVLLRGIRHEQHGVGRRKCGQRRECVGGGQAADAGRVDEREPALQELAGEEHLGAGDLPVAVAGLRALGHEVGELARRPPRCVRPCRRTRSSRARSLGEHERRRVLAVADARRNGGGDVVVDRADRGVDQRVHQLALALLELTDDDDPDARIEQAVLRLLEPPAEVGAVSAAREGDALVDEFDELSHRCAPPSQLDSIQADTRGLGPARRIPCRAEPVCVVTTG